MSKRAISWLSVLALLAALLPGPTARAAEAPLQAYYCGAPVTVDGVLREEQWALTDTAAGAPIGLLCSRDTLYLALRTAAASGRFTVGGTDFSAALRDGASTLGAAAYSERFGTAELAVPLAALGLEYEPGLVVPFTCTLDGAAWQGTLLLAGRSVVLADDFDNVAERSYASRVGATSSELYLEQGDGCLRFRTGSLSGDGADINHPGRELNASNFADDKGVEIEFTADFNMLPIPGEDQQGYLSLTGFAVDLRGSDWQQRYGFHADAQNNILVSQYEMSAGETVALDTGLDLPAAGVKVRIVMDEAHDSTVYINGKAIGSFTASRRVPSEATRGHLYLYHSTLRQSSPARENDVALYDLRVTQQAPAAPLNAPRTAADGAVRVDGSADEAYWKVDAVMDGARLGALCDSKNLYFALFTQEKSALIYINDRKLSCTLGASPRLSGLLAAGGAIAAGAGGWYELSIPIDGAGLTAQAGQEAPMLVSLGGQEKTFALRPAVRTLDLPFRAALASGAAQDAEVFLNVSGVTVDGALNENQWYLPLEGARRSGEAPAVSAGFLWDTEALYLGLTVHSDRRARSATLTLGSVSVIADLQTGTAAQGTLSAAGQSVEWRIPLSALGLTGAIGTACPYDLTVDAGDSAAGASGTLTLSGRRVVFGDAATDLIGREFTVTSNTTKTTWRQDGGSYRIATDPSLTGNEQFQMFRPLDLRLDDVPCPYEFSVDLTVESLPAYDTSLGWHGLCFEIRQSRFQSRYALRGDGRGNVLLDILYGSPLSQSSYCATLDTTVDFGRRATLKLTLDEDQIPRLYVDGRFVGQYPPLNRIEYTSTDSYPVPRLIFQVLNNARIADANGKVGGTNVVIHDVLWAAADRGAPKGRMQAALAQLSERAIRNGSPDGQALSGSLALPRTVTDPVLNMTYPVTWTAADALTGRASDRIDTATGAVRPGAEAAAVDLTASVSQDGVSARRVFPVLLAGRGGQGHTAFLANDDDPRTGRAADFSSDAVVTFDTTHNSLVYDQGDVRRFNRVTLYDSDGFSRVSRNDLSVYVSRDNVTYTRIADFMLHQEGPAYILYGLDAEARYVKVHTTLDDLESVTFAGFTDTLRDSQPSFRNRVQSMLSVEFETHLLGASGEFAHTAGVAVKNETGSLQKDAPVYLALSDLPAKSGEYQRSCADFRFTLDGRELAQYYDGSAGFWVRVPVLPAGGAELTVHWGCPSARDVSDGTAVFEAVYGSVSLIDLSDRTDLANSGRAFTFPRSGDVIVVAKNANQDLVMTRSTDGGRTFRAASTILVKRSWLDRPWGFGGYLYDEALGRLYLIAYSVKTKSDDINKVDGRMALMYTEDDGKTWTTPRFLNDEALQPLTNNDFTLRPSRGRTYSLTYCDGLKLKGADGSGPNVDYVITHSFMAEQGGKLAAAAIFSRDGGETWSASADVIDMDVASGHESGISETGLAQLDDGTLYVVARAQEDSNYYLYEAFSPDFGDHWERVGPSKIISTNTSPVLTEYKGERLLMWAGNNSLGGNARRRLPMTLAISKDGYRSFERSLDLTLGTAFDTLNDGEDRMTQPSIFFSPDGDEAFVCWTNLRTDRTVGFLAEDFDRMIHDTRGAFDDFEVTSLKYEGWLRDYPYRAAVSDEQAAGGQRSMKLTDALSSTNLYALRQIPSLKAGTVGMSLYVPEGNSEPFAVELKAGYNFTWLRHTAAAFSVAPDGTVSVCSEKGKTAMGRVAVGRWNSFAVSFDLSAGKGVLYVNGVRAGAFDLMAAGDRITVVQIGVPEVTQSIGSVLYVDDFYAVERQGLCLPVHSRLTYRDVGTDDWYYPAVAHVTANGLMSGYSADAFGAGDTLTRAQVVQVLYNREGQPPVSDPDPFSDVPDNQWYYNAVRWGAARNVVAGYGGGVFKPEDPVTLEQVAVILWNYSGKPAADPPSAPEGAHSDWADDALRWAAEQGLLDGMPTADPTAPATRAQTAQMLKNYGNTR